jgi:hypothetical protein
MRRRRSFTPVVDLMPNRISPSAIIVAPPVLQGVSAPPASGAVQSGAMDDTTGSVSTTLILGEPTPPSGTINC